MPALFQHAYPRLLEEVFGQLTVVREVQKVAEQPVLILLDKTVEQLSVATAQAASDFHSFVHPALERRDRSEL